MLSFKRIFQTHQQAMDVYKSQLSKQHLFVESFEGASKGTPVRVIMKIIETGQSIALDGNVERPIGKSEATNLGYGTRPGLFLSIPITKDIIAPLRTFFLAQSKQPAVTSTTIAPFADIPTCTPQEADREATQFLRNAENGNLFQLFGLKARDNRKELRQIYNKVVKNLHPDKHRADFDEELSDKLSDAYQILNEAYKILQHNIASTIYLEASQEMNHPNGMSLSEYKKFQADYRLKNANNIRMAEELVEQAENAISAGNNEEAMQHLKLALKYDKYNETVRSMQNDICAQK